MILYVDMIDVCHLRCPTCVKGVRSVPNTSTKMPLDKFRETVRKGKSEGAYQVSLFNWIDPFLCRDLLEYVKIIRSFDLPCELSTTLSFPRIHELDGILRHVGAMTVSVSGFSQEIYGVNHKGGDVAWVKLNLERIAEFKRRGEDRVSTHVTVRYLLFDYNASEIEPFRDYVESLGLRFEVYLAEGHPIRAPQAQNEEANLKNRLVSFNSASQNGGGKVCPLIFEHVVVNAAGDAYQCTAYGYYDAMKIGPYLELSREEILLRRYAHPVCNSCRWTRRDSTGLEKKLLSQAFAAQLGEPVESRIERLSSPDDFQLTTPEGYLVAKSQASAIKTGRPAS